MLKQREEVESASFRQGLRQAAFQGSSLGSSGSFVGAGVTGGALRAGRAALVDGGAAGGVGGVEGRAAGQQGVRQRGAAVVGQRAKQGVADDAVAGVGGRDAAGGICGDIVAERGQLDDTAAIWEEDALRPTVAGDDRVSQRQRGAGSP